MGGRADLRVFGWGGGGGQNLEFLDGAPITTFFEL